MRPTASTSSAICLTAVSTALRDCVISPTAAEWSRLHRLRGARDVVVGRDHGLGGLLQVVEPLGLVGDAACDLLDVAGDVGKLDAEAADAIGKLVNKTFGQCLVGLSVQDRKLHKGHVRAFSSQSR